MELYGKKLENWIYVGCLALTIVSTQYLVFTFPAWWLCFKLSGNYSIQTVPGKKKKKKKKQALEFSSVWSSLIPEAHFTSEFSKQTLRCCFIIGLSYPKYGVCQEADLLTTFLPLLISDLGKYSSCFIISSHAASESDKSKTPKWSTWDLSHTLIFRWLLTQLTLKPWSSFSLGWQQNMQLEHEGKESCTIFSSSTDLNLLKLTGKAQLLYARNNSQNN